MGKMWEYLEMSNFTLRRFILIPIVLLLEHQTNATQIHSILSDLDP
ncbi:MAG: hypothetical protein ACW972_04580 [Promethearchaeota archaeon]